MGLDVDVAEVVDTDLKVALRVIGGGVIAEILNGVRNPLSARAFVDKKGFIGWQAAGKLGD